MAIAFTPVPATMPARRSRRITVAALTPMVCSILAVIGVTLALASRSQWDDLPRPLVIWSTALGLFAIAVGSYWAARTSGHSPWIAPISLQAIYVFFRFGWGTLVAQYCEDYPWVAYPARRWHFHTYGVWQYLPSACHLILVFGVGMTIGGLLALANNRSVLPRFSWPFSEEKLKKRALIYAPVAAAINLSQFVLPVSIRFTVKLLGDFIYPLIMLGAYYLFRAKDAKERAQWTTFLIAAVALTCPIGLITGQVNGLMMPFICVFLGYTIARGSPPWKLIAVVLPIFLFVILPFVSLYKWAGGWTQDIVQRLETASKRYAELGYRGRLELTLERTLIRFAGSNHPALYSRFYPTVYPFEYGRSFELEASTIVPRPLWPDKPIAAYELNRYPAKVGMIGYESGTSAIFDAISEYYINFGLMGLFFLSIMHGYFWQALYNWLRLRVHHLVGMVLILTLTVQNEDYYGVGLLLTSMIKSIPVWILLFYLLSRAPRPKKA